MLQQSPPVDRNVRCGDRRPRVEVHDPRFTTDPGSIRMEVKEHPMLRRSQPMTSTPKPYNTRKYYEFHEQNGQTTANSYRRLFTS